MKTKGIFISTLLVIDTFFVSYAVGFQSRHVLIINPKLPPVVQKKVEAKPIHTAVPAKKGDTKEIHKGKGAHASKTHGKAEDKSGAAAVSTPAKEPAADATKPAPKPVQKPVSKPTIKPVTKPAKKPMAKPAAKPASAPTPKAPPDGKPGA